MFRIFDIPVRVHPFFFVTAVVIGFEPQRPDWMERLLTWIAIMFAGVLMHELGHAFAGRRYGLTPHIQLTAFGGVTGWQEGRGLSPRRSIAVSFAGPAVGLVIGLTVSLAAQVPLDFHTNTAGYSLGRYALTMIVWVNFWWAVLNLVPMLPLDGGNIATSAFDLWVPGGRSRTWARYLSIAVALGIAAWAFATGRLFLGLVLGYLVWINVREMRMEQQIRAIGPYREAFGRALAALAHGDGAGVVVAAQELVGAQHAQVQVEGQLLLAWGRLLGGDLFGARAAADKVPSAAAGDSALQGAFLLAEGDDEGAERHFEALERDPADQARFAAAFIATGRYDVAVKLLRSDRPPAAAEAPIVGYLAAAADRTGHPREAEALRAILSQLQ